MLMQKQTYPSDGVISHWDFCLKPVAFARRKRICSQIWKYIIQPASPLFVLHFKM